MAAKGLAVGDWKQALAELQVMVLVDRKGVELAHGIRFVASEIWWPVGG